MSYCFKYWINIIALYKLYNIMVAYKLIIFSNYQLINFFNIKIMNQEVIILLADKLYCNNS